MQPAFVAEFVGEFHREWRRLASKARAQAVGHLRERATLDRRIANLVEAISDGRFSPAIMTKLSELEAQRTGLGDLPALLPAATPALHAGIADLYAAKVRHLAAELANNDNPRPWRPPAR